VKNIVRFELPDPLFKNAVSIRRQSRYKGGQGDGGDGGMTVRAGKT
jgi:hypothetical protein